MQLNWFYFCDVTPDNADESVATHSTINILAYSAMLRDWFDDTVNYFTAKFNKYYQPTTSWLQAPSAVKTVGIIWSPSNFFEFSLLSSLTSHESFGDLTTTCIPRSANSFFPILFAVSTIGFISFVDFNGPSLFASVEFNVRDRNFPL